ncbi:hypothetical protein AGMMS49949_05470 [Alphaproteobacteria bacterium]|nr:hypothetical protein AGMMS49949_05470 [Alphaproteobacteria bacterium]GHS97605.1 hypothetical protein AGMMS50296_4720 [Alphaproteobacteria bacterium]
MMKLRNVMLGLGAIFCSSEMSASKDWDDTSRGQKFPETAEEFSERLGCKVEPYAPESSLSGEVGLKELETGGQVIVQATDCPWERDYEKMVRIQYNRITKQGALVKFMYWMPLGIQNPMAGKKLIEILELDASTSEISLRSVAETIMNTSKVLGLSFERENDIKIGRNYSIAPKLRPLIKRVLEETEALKIKKQN